MKFKVIKYNIAKFFIALVFIAILFACGKFHVFFQTGNIDAEKYLKSTFTVYQIKSGETEKNIIDDFTVMALGLDVPSKTEVFNPQPQEGEEGDIEDKAESVPYESNPVVETQISYTNSGEFINWNEVLIKNHTSKTIDLLSLMKDYTPVKKSKEPQILILHTHATEGYEDSLTSRTQDTERNVVRVGKELTDALKKKGYNVLHDVKLHDYPSYNGSYKNSLKTAEWYLEHYPSLQIVLDVHRDAIEKEDGTKVKITSEQSGKKAAQLMFVVGTDEGGLPHKNWQENLKFATGLQQVTTKLYPNLMRPIDLRIERFNQHVTKNYMIVEFGSNGNTLDEALESANLLANAISEYIK